jgi:hypothetical protein
MTHLPGKGIDFAPYRGHAGNVNPRSGLIAGAAIAGAVALVLLIAPTEWLADRLDVTGEDATTFLIRRYAASATAALFVATAGLVRGARPHQTGLLALAAWFTVQGVVAMVGVASGTVGGLVWLAVFIDPFIAAWFFALSRTAQRNSTIHHP